MKKKILLGVSGGIAAYKAIDLASKLMKEGCEVQTILTDSALKFISPLNFEAITHNTAHTTIWDESDPIPHINLSDWCDMMVVAPATANIMAKAASGIADDLLSTTLLACNKPILWIPAMNVKMYENPATIANIQLLKERGQMVMEPETGMLACAYEGKGKYPDNTEIIYAIKTYLEHKRDLQGIKVLVTAGSTQEDIDPMRMITNKSSGKMGLALARALSLRGAQVSLVYGHIQDKLPHYLFGSTQTLSVNEMYDACIGKASKMDWIIKCAAVSDYKPKESHSQKIKKADDITLELIRTKDILKSLGESKAKDQKLIGFAAETEDIIAHAKEKLCKKNLDLIVANELKSAGKDENKVYILKRDDANIEEYQGDKFSLAHKIIDEIKKL